MMARHNLFFVALVLLLSRAASAQTGGTTGSTGDPTTGTTGSTGVPTTAVPTTAVPTTAVPTTAVPTTAVSTTGVPATSGTSGGANRCNSNPTFENCAVSGGSCVNYIVPGYNNQYQQSCNTTLLWNDSTSLFGLKHNALKTALLTCLTTNSADTLPCIQAYYSAISQAQNAQLLSYATLCGQSGFMFVEFCQKAHEESSLSSQGFSCFSSPPQPASGVTYPLGCSANFYCSNSLWTCVSLVAENSPCVVEEECAVDLYCDSQSNTCQSSRGGGGGGGGPGGSFPGQACTSNSECVAYSYSGNNTKFACDTASGRCGFFSGAENCNSGLQPYGCEYGVQYCDGALCQNPQANGLSCTDGIMCQSSLCYSTAQSKTCEFGGPQGDCAGTGLCTPLRTVGQSCSGDDRICDGDLYCLQTGVCGNPGTSGATCASGQDCALGYYCDSDYPSFGQCQAIQGAGLYGGCALETGLPCAPGLVCVSPASQQNYSGNFNGVCVSVSSGNIGSSCTDPDYDNTCGSFGLTCEAGVQGCSCQNTQPQMQDASAELSNLVSCAAAFGCDDSESRSLLTELARSYGRIDRRLLSLVSTQGICFNDPARCQGSFSCLVRRLIPSTISEWSSCNSATFPTCAPYVSGTTTAGTVGTTTAGTVGTTTGVAGTGTTGTTGTTGDVKSATELANAIATFNWTSVGLVNVTNQTLLTIEQAASLYNVTVRSSSSVALIRMEIAFSSFDDAAKADFEAKIALSLGVDEARLIITFKEGSVIAIIEILAAPLAASTSTTGSEPEAASSSSEAASGLSTRDIILIAVLVPVGVCFIGLLIFVIVSKDDSESGAGSKGKKHDSESAPSNSVSLSAESDYSGSDYSGSDPSFSEESGSYTGSYTSESYTGSSSSGSGSYSS